jgi:hypothetical protein
MDRVQTPADSAAPRGSSGLSVIVRVYWMLVGNFPLVICAGLIAQAEQSPSWPDAVYWASVPALIGARYWDVAHLDGRTADGSPATLAHWKRYALGLAAVALVIWLAMNGIARLGVA